MENLSVSMFDCRCCSPSVTLQTYGLGFM